MTKKYILLGLLTLLACGKNPTAPKKVPQIIVAPKVSSVQETSAVISWETDIEATSVIRYDEKSGALSRTIRNDNQEKSHRIQLAELKSKTKYYFIAESGNKDGSSNSAEFSFSTLPNLSQMVDSAWTVYQAKNYLLSIQLFKSIVNGNPIVASAWSGLGWSYLSPTVDSLANSLYAFDRAVVADKNNLDAMVGRGFVYLAMKNYGMAVENLEKVLSASPNYQFSYDPSIDKRDILLGLAMAYFYKQEYTNAQNRVNLLVPTNGLSSTSSSTWKVDGTTYASYAEALLAWIEKIRRG